VVAAGFAEFAPVLLHAAGLSALVTWKGRRSLIMERQERERRLGLVRPAFTLVELLVVITIIGMLVALLMPAVSAAREQARRTSCMNNQMQVAVALRAYEGSHNVLPGWLNSISGVTAQVPWLAMIMPNLERADLWQQIKGGTTPNVSLRVLICPSDPPPTTSSCGPSAYIANGLVLRLGTTGASTTTPPPLTLDYVSGADGTTNTLMLGENTQNPPAYASNLGALAKAHNWYDATSVASGINPQLAQTFGFAVTGSAYAAAYTGFAGIYGTGYGSNFSQYNGNAMLANMNSAHSGGAVVVFCDGHSIFLRDDVGITVPTGGASPQTVYQILVTPDGSKLGGEPVADESQWNG
jgi:prepilin-type N-terminal cleavage/methylation domain-containing protein/prepilin-type processing-associated H-X9-DG protein